MRIVAVSTVAAPLLASLHAQAFAAAPGDVWDVDFFNKLLALPTTRGLIVEAEDEPVGFILWQQTIDAGEIITIAVLPDVQCKGLGRALIAAYEAELRQDSVPDSILDVAEDNVAARALYDRTQYEEIHRRAAYYKRYEDGREFRVDALVMRKELSL